MDYYPALEDVYDLSTQDLKKVQQQLRINPNGHQDLLETIILEIQERKALEYFAEICHADNPYAKKVAAFNEQFLKLAAEAIEKNHNSRSQGHNQYEPTQLPPFQQPQAFKLTSKSQPDITYHIQSENQSEKQKSHLDHRQYTDNDAKSIQSQQASHSDAISTTTTTSIAESKTQQRSSRVAGDVKMNLGVKKEGKGKMKQIVKNTLARTLIQDEIVIKRNNANSPHSNLNPHKKYHIPGQKHEEKKKSQNAPNSHKAIKSKQEIKLKQQQKSNKNIKPNSQDSKKKQQILAKMKQESKKGTVKLPKINQYKDLVEMVKQQEEKRRQRATRAQNLQKLPIIQNPNSTQNRLQESETQLQGHISQQIQIQTRQIKKNSHSASDQDQLENKIIQQQSMEQSLSPEKIQKLPNSRGIQESKDGINEAQTKQSHEVKQKAMGGGKIQKQNVSRLESEKTPSIITPSTQSKPVQSKQLSQAYLNDKAQGQTVEKDQQKVLPSPIPNHDSDPSQSTTRNKDLQANIDYTKKLLEQIQQHENNFVLVQKEQVPEIDSQDIISTDSSNKVRERRSQQNAQEKEKKCYSQEYWAHIRQQAELKIKRFKQEKEYEQKKEMEKFEKTANNTNSDAIEDVASSEDLNSEESIETKVLEKLKLEQKMFEQQLAKRGEELNKLKKQAMKKTNKKVAEAQATQKITFLRPKPDFNYLDVYPSFNHIFSVMYLKPTSQALNEIPNIMREVKTLFSTHIEHFSNRSNFKPAIFLPFDHNGTFQLTDPKQLIAHAQQTYIDLKTMIERVQIFNQNLHGQFNNANDDRFYRVVKTKEEVYDIITTSFMRRKGWKELPHGCSLRTSWNLFWSWSKPDVDLSKLLIWQRINHFPFNKNLSRKDLLYKNLDLFRKSYKVSMNFLPLTFNLPKQFSQLSAKFHEQEMLNRDNNFWIMKPIGKSRGRGIKVVSSLSELNYTDNIVVQKYILNPMLIDGYKFDMRIYVLVTSFHPLEAFVYREGFARLSTEKYTLDAHSIKNTFVHLTNFAINKNNVSSNSNFAGGSKISLKTLKDKITRMGHSFSNIWTQVHDIIIKSLLGCSVSVPSFPTAFQLFGYDIMIDQQCHCHLIQINASPSLERSYMIDQIVKQNLIDDIVDLVDPPDFDKAQLLDVFNERIQAIANRKKISTDEDLIGLARILRYKPIRKIGQKPLKMGLFETVAPCESSKELQILIKAKSGANNPLNID